MTRVIQQLDDVKSLSTCVVENPPLKYRYFKNAVLLERPHWDFVEITNGLDEAKKHQPCVFLQFTHRDGNVYVKTIEIRGRRQPTDGRQ